MQHAARSTLGPMRYGADTLLYTARARPIACCYSISLHHSDEARLLALGYFSVGADGVAAALEGLIERACLRAAGEGKLRVSARAEEDSDACDLLRWLGFTSITREQVYFGPCDARSSEGGSELEPLHPEDAWDVWKLYNRTEPAGVQRAEALTPSTWQRGRRLRSGRRREWVYHSAPGEAALHAELRLGKRSAALNLHYDPEYRRLLPDAINQARLAAAQHGAGTLYCTARDHQAELSGVLEEMGHSLLVSQSRLVMYTSVLSYAQEARAIGMAERAASVFRNTLSSRADPDRDPHVSDPEW